MPSLQARTATQRQRRELALVTTAVANRVEAAANSATAADIDQWWDVAAPGITRTVATGHALAATITTRYLRQHAAIEGALVNVERADMDPDRLETSLLVTGPVAFKTHMRLIGDPVLSRRVMVDTLRGSAVRLSLSGARDTTTATAQSSNRIVGWRRVAVSSPCAFCAMVISRGAVYKSASGLPRASFHDHDRCTYEPLYTGEQEPAEVLAVRRQWEESTDGLSGGEAVNAFRREWEKANL